jgi:hypothetical protein
MHDVVAHERLVMLDVDVEIKEGKEVIPGSRVLLTSLYLAENVRGKHGKLPLRTARIAEI